LRLLPVRGKRKIKWKQYTGKGGRGSRKEGTIFELEIAWTRVKGRLEEQGSEGKTEGGR